MILGLLFGGSVFGAEAEVKSSLVGDWRFSMATDGSAADQESSAMMLHISKEAGIYRVLLETPSVQAYKEKAMQTHNSAEAARQLGAAGSWEDLGRQYTGAFTGTGSEITALKGGGSLRYIEDGDMICANLVGCFKRVSDTKIDEGAKEAGSTSDAGLKTGNELEADRALSKAKEGRVSENITQDTNDNGTQVFEASVFLEQPMTGKKILDDIAAWTKDNGETPGKADYEKGTISWKQTMDNGTKITSGITVKKINSRNDLFFKTTVAGATRLGRDDVGTEYENIIKAITQE